MKNVYVGNLPHSATESELRALFQPHGEIENVTMVTDRDTGRSRGFAFVEMSSDGDAEKAIAALNNTEMGGRTLTINAARPKTEGSRGGGGGKRFGGGRDDYRGKARRPREPRW
ncbi:MAG TPA: RNA-binding protein [Terriglobales bacterium]|jgi:RNA recognition motif-containing protein|nr:RNA-binding protein [Terriglobales bacterium]